MAARATTQEHTGTADGVTPPRVRRTSWRRRLRSRLRGDYQEDGVFRPVRLSLWTDLVVSAAIVLVAIGSFAGFLVWLAHTRQR